MYTYNFSYSNTAEEEFPYQLWTMYENGNIVGGHVPGFHDACIASGSTGNPYPDKCATSWYVNGKRVYQYFAW